MPVTTILFGFLPWVVAIILMVCMFAAILLGWQLGKRRRDKTELKDDHTSGNLINGIFALSAFLLAFTFSIASNRYDSRRNNLVQEANNIGTAILRIDLYPDSMQQILRPLFKEYVESRIAYFEVKRDANALIKSSNEANAISSKIWKHCTAYFRQSGNMVTANQMIPALNAMIDIVTTRQQQLFAIVPESIVLMLFVLMMISSFLTGFMHKHEKINWLVLVSFCALSSFVVYIVLDLDHTRTGLINLNVAEQSMLDLRQLFN